jgi:hypothetical protein
MTQMKKPALSNTRAALIYGQAAEKGHEKGRFQALNFMAQKVKKTT